MWWWNWLIVSIQHQSGDHIVDLGHGIVDCALRVRRAKVDMKENRAIAMDKDVLHAVVG